MNYSKLNLTGSSAPHIRTAIICRVPLAVRAAVCVSCSAAWRGGRI